MSGLFVRTGEVRRREHMPVDGGKHTLDSLDLRTRGDRPIDDGLVLGKGVAACLADRQMLLQPGLLFLSQLA